MLSLRLSTNYAELELLTVRKHTFYRTSVKLSGKDIENLINFTKILNSYLYELYTVMN